MLNILKIIQRHFTIITSSKQSNSGHCSYKYFKNNTNRFAIKIAGIISIKKKLFTEEDIRNIFYICYGKLSL